MKLATFEHRGRVRLGAIRGGAVVDLASGGNDVPATIEEVLLRGASGLDVVRNAVAGNTSEIPLDEVRLHPPIRHPRKFLGIGFNYRSHLEELEALGRPVPKGADQLWFNKQVSCIAGPYDPIHMPRVSRQLDYEGELGVVIGRRCRHVRSLDAHRVIFGYLVCNDVSVRDWQARSPTATLGKSFDTHGPCGPWITTSDEVAEPERLWLRTWVDGELRQDGNTSEMVSKLGDMIAYLSSVFTLEPGDILCTGTPAGVGQGFDPPRFLTVGQRVRVEIEGLGAIENEVIAEPATTAFIR